jgi:hypothetical protein
MMPCLYPNASQINHPKPIISDSKPHHIRRLVVTTVVAMLGLLVLVLELRSHYSTGYSAHDSVPAQFIPTKVPSSATSKSTH